MKRQLTGKVISDKMAKTAVVSVESLKKHPKYGRRYRSSKKYKAHDEKNECRPGDLVLIEECRPLSADKRWRVMKKIAAASSEELPQNAIADDLTAVEKEN